MIGEYFDRITFLINHRRYEDAVKEINQAIIREPNNPYLFLLLAESHNELNKPTVAIGPAKQAVHLQPDSDSAHRTLAKTYNLLNKEKNALNHALEAIAINPEEADNQSMLAATYLQLSNWKKALEAANQGLAIEPEHRGCLNIRTMALTKLGRKKEVDDTIRAALRENPDDAMTHANWGWVLLHQGKSDKAISHFKEALKLDPTLEWARVGIVEAIKGKNIVYGLMLRFYLWLGKFPPRIQIMLIIGMFFAEKIIRLMVSSVPVLAPLADWILIAYVSFVFMAWMSISFFNLLLRIHPEGKLALSDKQKTGSTWFAVGLVMTLILSAIMYVELGVTQGLWGLLIPVFLLFPTSVAIKAKPGKTRIIMIAYTITGTLFLILGIFTKQFHFINICLIMSVLSTWLGNFIPRDNEVV